MTSPSRVFAVLDLFTRDRPIWNTDEINTALGYSRATGYRYVKDLVEAGFLQKVAAGRYALGARIIELDYQLRQSDPVLLAAVPIMDRLAASTGLDVVLSAMFGGFKVVDIHRTSSVGSLNLQYGRGRPRPLFLGAAPKVILSRQPRATLLRLFEAHTQDIESAGLGSSWAEFRNAMANIRQAGIYVSLGELDEGVGAAAVPIENSEGDTVAALAVVGSSTALAKETTSELLQTLDEAAIAIRSQL